MSLRNALIMSIILALGVGYLVYENSHAPAGLSAGGDEHGSTIKIIEGLRGDAIASVQFKNDKTDFHLEKVADPAAPKKLIWRVREVPYYALDPDVLLRILDLLTHLQALNFISDVEADADRANYGLSNPSLVVRVNSASAPENVELRFGERHKLSGRRYLEVAERPGVFVVDEATYKQLALTPIDMRERRPLRVVSLTNLQGVTVKRKASTLVFSPEKSGDYWTVSEEGGTEDVVAGGMEVDAKTWQGLVSTLTKLSAVDFFDHPAKDLEKFGLQQPIVSLLLKLSGRKRSEQNPELETENTVVVNIGEVRGDGLQENGILPKRDYYFQLNGQLPIYKAEKRFFTDFLQGLHFFRNRQPLRTLNPEQITKLTIGRRESVPILIERESSRSWKAKQGEKVLDVDRSSLSDLLTELQQLTVLSYVEENTTLGPVSDESKGPELFISFEAGETLGALTVYGAVGELANPSAPQSSSEAPRLASVRIGAAPAIRFILSSELFKSLNSLQSAMLEG